MVDSSIRQHLIELRARIEVGNLSRDELVELLRELNAIVAHLTETLQGVNRHIEHMRRSEEQNRLYRK